MRALNRTEDELMQSQNEGKRLGDALKAKSVEVEGLTAVTKVKERELASQRSVDQGLTQELQRTKEDFEYRQCVNKE